MSNFVKLRELYELADQVGLSDDKSFMATFQRLSVRWNDWLFEKTLEMLIAHDKRSLLDTTFPVPMKADDLKVVDAPYKIGVISGTDIEYGLTPHQLQMHGVIGGQSGFGKTTLIKILCRQIIKEGKVFIWVLDPKGEGGDFRFLAKESDTVILRPEVMKLNPFTPIPRVAASLQRESIAEILAGAWGVMDAGEGVIIEHIQKVMQKHEKPTMYDFIDSLSREKGYGRRQTYLDTLETRHKKARISLGDILNCKVDYIPRLYNRNVVFEIGELSGNAQEFLTVFLIMNLVLYKMKNPTRHLSHVIVFDEGQTTLWSKYHELRGRVPYAAKLATQARGWGLSIIVLAQNPVRKLMEEITANATIKISYQLGNYDESIGFGRTMGLTPAQIDALHHFGIGEAVCRTSHGYTYPVHLEIFNFDPEPVSTDELCQLMRPKWDDLLEGLEPAIESEPEQLGDPKSDNSKSNVADSINEIPSGEIPQEENPLEKIPLEKDSIKKEKNQEKSAAGRRPPALSDDEETYLRMVASHPWRLITEIYSLVCDDKIMGTDRLSKNRAINARQKLVSKGYLESFIVTGTGRSGKAQCDIISKHIGKVEHPRGGLLHSFWCFRVAEYFKNQGGDVKIADTSTDNEIDLTVSLDGKRIAVEIVVSGLVVENVKRSQGLFDKVLIMVIDHKKKKEFENIVSEKIEIAFLKDYFISL